MTAVLQRCLLRSTPISNVPRHWSQLPGHPESNGVSGDRYEGMQLPSPEPTTRQTQLTNTPLKVHGAIGILWSAVNTLVKLSMADLYTRIFPHRLMRITAMTFSVVSVINFIFATAAAAVSCDPAASAAQRVITRNCYMALGIINLLLDIVIIVMPMPALSTLQLPIGKKISLIGIFALGFVITAISAVRVAAFSDGLRNIMGGKGYAYNSYAMSLWSYLETSLSVINACLPVIFPALLAITGRLESLRSRIKGSAGSLRKYGRHSPSNGSAGKSDPSFPPTTTIGESRRFGRFWRTPNLDKTLPARPTHCSSETCVSAGDGAGHSGHGVGGYSRDEEKATFYLEETRVGDEGSLSDSEKLPEERTLAERRGMEGGKITVVKGWVVGYESR